MSGGPDRAHVRLAELVAALSLGIDLGFGQPMEHVLRQCLIALRLAERMGLDEQARGGVYYTALLINVGCHSDAHEQAKWFGDDIALKAGKYGAHDLRSLRGRRVGDAAGGRGQPALASPARRLRLRDVGPPRGRRDDRPARRDWRGGWPSSSGCRRRCSTGSAGPTSGGTATAGRTGSRASRSRRRRGSSQFAEFVEVAHRLGGTEAATALARRRAGTQFDPVLTAMLCEDPGAILDGLDTIGTWDAVIGAEPALALMLSGERFDAALLAVANFVDLKSPYTGGHSRAVAELAAEAGRRLDLPEPEVRELRRAGLVHDFGRLGVSNAIWDKRGPLGAGERERVRLHPYLTERMLHGSAALAPLGAVALQHCERLDGSGYPRGLSGAAISRPARILGAADAYQAMREPRPHRPPRSAGEAARAAARRRQGGPARRRRRRCGACPPPGMRCRAGARARRA